MNSGLAPGNGHLFVSESVEERQGGQCKGQGETEGNQREQNGFAEELGDELAAERADGLSYPYFSCAFFAPGSGQVHKIDTGEQQHEDADDAEEPDHGDAAADGFIKFKLAVQIGFIERIDQDLFVEILFVWSG